MYGLFLGIHCADGTLPKYKGSNQYLWEFSDRDKEAADFVVELLRKEFEAFALNIHVRQRGNQYVVFVKNKKFWKFLTEELKLPVGKKAETIDIPSCVSTEEFKDFVNGVIGSDGFVFQDWNGTPRVRLRIRGKQLRDRISEILYNLKITHTTGESIEDLKPPNAKKVYHVEIYRLDVYGKNAIKYFNEIGIWHPIKKRKFLKFCDSVRSRETGTPR